MEEQRPKEQKVEGQALFITFQDLLESYNKVY